MLVTTNLLNTPSKYVLFRGETDHLVHGHSSRLLASRPPEHSAENTFMLNFEVKTSLGSLSNIFLSVELE